MDKLNIIFWIGIIILFIGIINIIGVRTYLVDYPLALSGADKGFNIPPKIPSYEELVYYGNLLILSVILQIIGIILIIFSSWKKRKITK